MVDSEHGKTSLEHPVPKNILCAKTGACQAAQRPTDLTEIQPPHASVQKNVKEKIF